MNIGIPLSNLSKTELYDDEASASDLIRGFDSNLYPIPKAVKRNLILNLIWESCLSITIYYNYNNLAEWHRLLAPAFLGAATAMLAQSFNQFYRKKLNYSKILKFLIWGIINGCFTNLWIDLLVFRFENLAYRVLVDQMVGAPFFQLIFNILSNLWDYGEISTNFKVIYLRSLKYSYCFWPFFSIASFIFIPQQFLFHCNCLANLFWSLILSKLG